MREQTKRQVVVMLKLKELLSAKELYIFFSGETCLDGEFLQKTGTEGSILMYRDR